MLLRFVECLRSGEKSADELAQLCIRRIAERDSEIRAWVQVSPQPPLGEGQLDGIPFGAKDIFETRGLATEFGSPIYAGRTGACDARLVTELRQRGAVLLGKTHTTAFAYFDPAPTRNPRDLGRTPGGSSSGSAAAVAAGMVPFALGSQTQGSIIRPASFCGVVGFKPTFGVLSTEGVLPFAPSLDTVGYFTETAADMRLLGSAAPDSACMRLAAFSLDCEPDMLATFRDAIARLRATGFAVTECDPPGGFDLLWPATRTICDYEGARTHRARCLQYGERIGRKLAELVKRGLAIWSDDYRAALDSVQARRRTMANFFAEYPVVLTPAAPGAAPLGLESTGDPRMNGPWTALGSPAISVPMPVEGPPLGLQMTAVNGQDAMLIETAVAAERCWRPS
jgi:Asp-tRNA(Asn)/Glu-tRNA(Gln) amidotransferase A subunit family amidase